MTNPYPISDAAASLPSDQLEAAFQEASVAVKTLAARPPNAVLLQLYALYKQGSEGDATGERPGMTDFVGRAKFDAWSELAGVERETAQRQYITLVDELRTTG